MKKIKYCSECGEKSSRLVHDRYATEIKHDGKAYQIEVSPVPLYRCDTCGAVTLTDEADEAITAELRRAAGLLQPEEIKQGMLDLGLTQKQFAEKFGVAEATVSRWVTGGQVQQGGYDRAIRSYFENESARATYERCRAAPAIRLPP